MNKGDLVEAIAAAAGVSKAKAQVALDTTLGTIVDALKKGEKVTLVGFGTFSTVKRKARTGVNPRTKESIKIKAKKVPKFVAGARLKEAASKAKIK